MTGAQTTGVGSTGDKDFHFPPLTNGLDFVISAVDSLAAEDGPAPRELKYAVLHLQAAAETLFKARLEMHEPSLVWTKPDTYSEAKHTAGAFNSCSIKVALERLNSLAENGDITIETSLDPGDVDLEALGKLRNRIMHFGWRDSAVAVQARTLPVLTLLFDFVSRDVLPYVETFPDSWTAEKQMEKVRSQLKHLTDFVAHRTKSIAAQLDGYEHSTVACRSCGQHALVLDGGAIDLECLFCGKAYGSGEEAAWEFIGEDRYIAIKDGGSDFANCESCGSDAVVAGLRTAASPDTDSYICFSCGADWDGICGYCGSGGHLVMEDMCENCYEIRLAKF
ncbi:hypothetical protein OG894_42120 (plasmid) [Streptomyces sp. NBC_01724]|uniref:hypothetical protein n=1 Tax=Streptomyces sp. NBC_01724 TaxID=2975922 RepID=UPI002E2FC936|nr:hypothetical protein [Streptomyces sp. NBC_01724]